MDCLIDGKFSARLLENISPVVESKALFNGLLRRLGGDTRGRKGIDVDDRQSCGIATALEMQRLLVGGVNVNHIAWFHINSNAFRGVAGVNSQIVPNNRVDSTATTAWLKKGDKVGIPNRGENSLGGSDRSPILDHLIGGGI